MTSTDTAAAQREKLAWNEICRRHPDCWVVLADTDWVNDTDFDFQGASVIATFAHRKDASPMMKALLAENREAGCFWTGEIRGPVPRFTL